jgi:hypothetical protein
LALKFFYASNFDVIGKSPEGISNLQTLSVIGSDDTDILLRWKQGLRTNKVVRSEALHTCAEVTIGSKGLYVSFDQRNFINVEERWRRRFPKIFPRNRVEYNGESLGDQMRRIEVMIGDFGVCTRLQLSLVEPLVWKFQDRIVRSVVLDQLDDTASV